MMMLTLCFICIHAFEQAHTRIHIQIVVMKVYCIGVSLELLLQLVSTAVSVIRVIAGVMVMLLAVVKHVRAIMTLYHCAL